MENKNEKDAFFDKTITESKSIATKDMSLKELILLMCEGDPEALNVILQMLDSKAGLLNVYLLDSLGIRGHKIWMLYNDCCGQDLDKLYRTLTLLAGGGYSYDEMDANFALPRAIPFLVKDEKDYTGDGEEPFGFFHRNWGKFVRDNRAEVIPMLISLTDQYGVPEMGGRTR